MAKQKKAVKRPKKEKKVDEPALHPDYNPDIPENKQRGLA